MRPIVRVLAGLPAAGMTLWPFILLKSRELKLNAVTMNHERIHIRQQAELLVLPFYILYVGNYLLNRLRYKGHNAAYMNICFEREAYANEADMGYLKRRGLWRWLRYTGK